ncbi:MAG: FAD-binding oxidoreductase, partial [Xanthomonadales bacterium]|nr:FAD-binding oxidoreductase [Xanthomonadales bacterium]
MAHAPSYYAASAHPQPERPALVADIEADVCVVGAGYTGLSTALHLAEAGRSVVVLEAELTGWGASGRNGGQIVHSYSRDMDVIERAHGAQAAAALGGMAFEGAQIIRERIERYHIQCDHQAGGIYAAKSARKARELIEHKALWERYGHRQLRLVSGSEIGQYVGSPLYHSLLIDDSGGHIHPLNLALGEATALEGLGGRIYEHSAVVAVERGATARVRTATGSVRARSVVLAGNAYLGQLEPRLASRSMPCGTQVIATEPLGERWREILPQNHCVEDNDFLLDYYRLSADRRLLFGGGVIYGAREPDQIERLIRPNLERTFPQLQGIAFDYAWTGNFLL